MVEDTDNWFVQLFRYMFVGGAAFVVDFGLLYVLTEFAGFYYILSATLSFVAGLIVNYIFSTAWIFRHSKLSNRWTEFLVFSIIGVVGLGFNDLFLYLFTNLLGIYYMASKIIVAAIVMAWNFVARKMILFKNKN